ncbi:HpcH/HpaI aldolase/citrate lyase family protein [uncultured Oscillibacter sp.]|uniref:HpcH/HpaI aldolase family protein n=1 Tax=uncultured Oscillibacter sp. TaxID=876091 RepID=UPI0025F4C4C7|nr:aldolase/citrate lyase family protein [uncultured Oscillibacter sp.]
MNTLLKKRREGRTSYGTFSQIKSVAAIENIACAGLDYVVIDAEHAALGEDFIAGAVIAADAGGLCPLVRIPEISRRAVLHGLDAGAQGLIVPAVETVEEVRTLVRYAKFAPLGSRGYAPTRDGRWGTDGISRQGPEAYMDNSNRQTLLLPQCETLGCLEHIEEIAAMDGVDGIFVGPMDISIALGCPLQVDAAPVRSAMRSVLEACHRSGKLAMIYSNDAASAHRMAELGFDSVTVGADIFLLLGAYEKLAAELHEL